MAKPKENTKLAQVEGQTKRVELLFDGTPNLRCDEGAVYGIYMLVGEKDGEPLFRRVGEEVKAYG
jgi:hypothetical protein